MRRSGGRTADALRPVRLEPGYLDFADGSALVIWGRTRVLCAASVVNQVPPFKQYSGEGWVTAEYAMLPRATASRQPREGLAGRPRGRSQEIQRLIGRALRAVCDLKALGERTVIVDCDVLQADGGTRAAAITGAFVALALALEPLRRREELEVLPLTGQVAAVSLGRVGGALLLDLDYEEDSQAEVDATVVGTARGELVEVHVAGEGRTFPPELLPELLILAARGLEPLFRLQVEALAPWLPLPW
jgi:ribonuclease PH